MASGAAAAAATAARAAAADRRAAAAAAAAAVAAAVAAAGAAADDRRPYGVGIGWRPEIAGFVADLPGLRFVEVVAESVPARGCPGSRSPALRDRGVTVVPHGVRLSLGGAEPVDPAPGRRTWPTAAELLGAPLVSEHIAFVRAGGVEAGHLLPLPRTREAVDAVVANVAAHPGRAAGADRAGADRRAVRLARRRARRGATFLTEILERTGALLLLDIANVYANARNRGADPVALLDRLPLERVAYVHVAGGAEHDGIYHDTHTDPVPRTGARPGRARCAPGAARRRCCWSATATTRRPTTCAPSWTRSPPPPDTRRSRERPARRHGRPALVAALVGRGAPVPPGFDARLVGVARHRAAAQAGRRGGPALAAARGRRSAPSGRRRSRPGRTAARRTARCATAGTSRALAAPLSGAAAAELAEREAALGVRRRPSAPHGRRPARPRLAGRRLWSGRAGRFGGMDLGLADRVYVLTGASRGLGFATARVPGRRRRPGRRLRAATRTAVADAVRRLGGPARGRASPPTSATPRPGAARGHRAVGVRPARRRADLGGRAAARHARPPPPTTQWRQSFETVFLGAVRAARVIGAALGDGGAIGLVLSTSVRSPIEDLGISNGLRPGLAGVAKDMADEWGPRGVRVVSLLPGRMLTDRNRELYGAGGDLERHAGAARRGDPVAPDRRPGRVRPGGRVRPVPRRELPDRGGDPGRRRRPAHDVTSPAPRSTRPTWPRPSTAPLRT